MRQCWELMNEDILHSEPQAVSDTSALQISHLPTALTETIVNKLQTELEDSEVITVTKQLTVSHTLHKVECCLLLNVIETVFQKAKHTVNLRDTWLLCGRLCFCDSFNEYLHAYHVNTDGGWAVTYPAEEINHSVHTYFVQNECSYVAVAYHEPAVKAI